MTKWAYRFGDEKAEGQASQVDILGLKGVNLAEMSRLGIPVPPGFTISSEAWRWFSTHNGDFPQDLRAEVCSSLDYIAQVTGRSFGNVEKPLLLSVRSGSRVLMPGVIGTVLNVGLNDETVKAVVEEVNERFAYDSYRRFIQTYASVVFEIDADFFEDIIENVCEERGYDSEEQMTAEDFRELVIKFKACVEKEGDASFPQDPLEQLYGAIRAVFNSWDSTRAVLYRRTNSIPDDWGVSISVQAMVFGNRKTDSAAGVVMTRNPVNGEKELFGEFLENAQGLDMETSARQPQAITEKMRLANGDDKPSLEMKIPQAYAQLCKIADVLERNYRKMQEIKFTIHHGKVWILYANSAKPSTRVALKVAVEMAEAGMISRESAVEAIAPQSLDQLLHPSISPTVDAPVLAYGLAASPGAVSGEIVFTPEDARHYAKQGLDVILVRTETSPEDIHGMEVSKGVLTARGGITSHAAVIARGMGKPCVSGAGGLRIDYASNTLHIGGKTFHKGDVITIDGANGRVFGNRVPTVQPALSGDFAILMGWADSIRRMAVRANAESPREARMALSFGAEGIGLIRTEHMFFNSDGILAMRELILAHNEKGRREALNKLLPMQRVDFSALFEIVTGKPVTIRLLDAPLHEFLPRSEQETNRVAKAIKIEPEKLKERIRALEEVNPMLGFRGCRLAIAFPEIIEMQARAIFEASLEAASKTGAAVIPEIMVPLVGLKREFDFVRTRIDNVARDVMQEKNARIDYLVGTMIELPRSALRAGDIAEKADFFSFGTNDLTQTTFGISRDDAGPFLSTYLKDGLFYKDPFRSIDRRGVGELIEMAVERGRKAKPKLRLGVCGEHGGDPDSITFFDNVGLDYISCSPFRVPAARLAAAQATLKHKAQKE